MRICRKCSKRVSDDNKICRSCGAILEEIPDESLPGAGTQSESASQYNSPVAAEPPEVGLEGSDAQSVGELVVESEETPSPPNADASAWKCPRCSAMVPGTFDMCWNCLTTEDGEKADQGEPVLSQDISAADKPDEERGSQSACPRCGSAKMMFDVAVQDQGNNSDGRLKVVIEGNPSALIFKDWLYGNLTANICGDCGHVELRVSNPEELYRHYRMSRGL